MKAEGYLIWASKGGGDSINRKSVSQIFEDGEVSGMDAAKKWLETAILRGGFVLLGAGFAEYGGARPQRFICRGINPDKTVLWKAV